MTGEDQGELIPRPEGDDDQDEAMRLTTAQLILKFPDLAPAKYIPEECRKMDESKRYNGQRFKRDNPEAYAWVVKCLAAGLGYREIQRLGGPKYYVVKAIGFEEGIAIKEQKRHLANLYGLGSEAYAERALELVDKCTSGKDAMIAAGIFSDKHLQFSGDAALKIELNATVNFRDELRSLHEEAMQKLREMKRANVVEIGPAELEEGAA